MVERYWEALKGVMDPEIPFLSVVDLGMVTGLEAEGARVRVRFRPTFLGCPALKLIEEEIQKALKAAGAQEVEVVRDPRPWTTEGLGPEARRALERGGIAPPLPLPLAEAGAIPPCPRCGGKAVVRNAFGPTLCQRLYQCTACGEVFQGFKSV